MPAHWVFRFFPQAWPQARRVGFQVKQEERTFYEPVSAGVAPKIGGDAHRFGGDAGGGVGPKGRTGGKAVPEAETGTGHSAGVGV